MSPLKVLSRGYSITEKSGGSAIRSASELKAGEQIRIRFSEGSALASVDRIMEE